MTLGVALANGFVQGISRRASLYLGWDQPQLARRLVSLALVTATVGVLALGAAVLLGLSLFGAFSTEERLIFVVTIVCAVPVWFMAGSLSLARAAGWVVVGLAGGLLAGVAVYRLSGRASDRQRPRSPRCARRHGACGSARLRRSAHSGAPTRPLEACSGIGGVLRLRGRAHHLRVGAAGDGLARAALLRPRSARRDHRNRSGLHARAAAVYPLAGGCRADASPLLAVRQARTGAYAGPLTHRRLAGNCSPSTGGICRCIWR